jgi:hypothetical protein
MFNWSGNKGSFMGDIPFYGKTGLEFYTQRKANTLNWTDHRPPQRSGPMLTPLGQGCVGSYSLTNRPLWRCPVSIKRKACIIPLGPNVEHYVPHCAFYSCIRSVSSRFCKSSNSLLRSRFSSSTSMSFAFAMRYFTCHLDLPVMDAM